MKIPLHHNRDALAGLMFIAVGCLAIFMSRNFSYGGALRMGPGYFPLMLGILMAVLGAVITIKALVVKTPDGDKIGSWAWKPLFFVIAANLIFGVLLGGLPSIKLPAMGMIAAIYALTFVASLAGEEFKWREVVILATVLAVASYLGFIVLLQLQFPAWPAFITG